MIIIVHDKYFLFFPIEFSITKFKSLIFYRISSALSKIYFFNFNYYYSVRNILFDGVNIIKLIY